MDKPQDDDQKTPEKLKPGMEQVDRARDLVLTYGTDGSPASRSYGLKTTEWIPFNSASDIRIIEHGNYRGDIFITFTNKSGRRNEEYPLCKANKFNSFTVLDSEGMYVPAVPGTRNYEYIEELLQLVEEFYN